jgi:hypothetical protein
MKNSIAVALIASLFQGLCASDSAPRNRHFLPAPDVAPRAPNNDGQPKFLSPNLARHNSSSGFLDTFPEQDDEEAKQGNKKK